MADRVTKTEDGKEYTADAYLYVPDHESPSTWKLRIEEEPGKITVAQLGRAAAALGKGFRGNKVDIPEEERRKCAKKLIALYREQDVPDEDIPAYLWQIAGMNMPKSYITVKTAEDGSLSIGGYGVVWYTRDLYGDMFTPDTDLWLGKLTDAPILLYQHGFDDALGKTVLGRVKSWKRDEIGLWIEAQLEAHQEYREFIDAIARLANEGVLGLSSGAVSHLVEKTADGVIKSWAIAEFSLTPTPAEPRTLGVQVLRSIAEFVPEIKSYIPKDSDEAESGNGDIEEDKEENGNAVVGNEQDKNPDGEVKNMENINIDEVVKNAVDEALKRYDAVVKSAGFVPAVEEKPDEVKAFNDYLRGGAPSYKLSSNPTEGGYFIPQNLYGELIAKISEDSMFRKAGANVINLPEGVTSVPGFNYSTMASLTGEGVAFGEADPTATIVQFSQIKFTRLAKVPLELARNSKFDIWGTVLSRDFGNAFATAENYYFTKGTGTNQPQGIVNAVVGKTTASKAAITADELIDWVYSLSYLYRQRAVVMLADSTIAAIRKLKDTTNQYLWQPGLASGQPDRLLGFPVIPNNYLDTIGTANGIAGVIFDPYYYWIGVREEMTVQRLVERFAETGYIGYVAHSLEDARIMNPDAFRALKLAAT